MPYYYPQGSLVFAQDPTGAHPNPRPVIVISDVDRPFVEQETTVVCLTSQHDYTHDVARLPGDCVDGLTLRKSSYVMPWAIDTIPLSSIRESLPTGTVTADGLSIVADAIDGMVRP